MFPVFRIWIQEKKVRSGSIKLHFPIFRSSNFLTDFLKVAYVYLVSTMKRKEYEQHKHLKHQLQYWLIGKLQTTGSTGDVVDPNTLVAASTTLMSLAL